MYVKKTVIANQTGLHARPAAEFVALAGKFKSRITLRRLDNHKEANAKSIVFVLSLGLAKDTHVEIAAIGEDEVEAVDALVNLLETGLRE